MSGNTLSFESSILFQKPEQSTVENEIIEENTVRGNALSLGNSFLFSAVKDVKMDVVLGNSTLDISSSVGLSAGGRFAGSFEESASSVTVDPIQFSTVTSTGTPIYLRRRSKHSRRRSGIDKSRAIERDYHGVPIHDLLNELKRDNEIESQVRSTRNNAPRPKSTKKQLCNTDLLTEKWRAKDYYHLVGPEKAHRSIMKWIKCWDKVVHKKPQSDDQAFIDSLGRPMKKILLVHGAPGIGKTTAVHVLARQAGYNIMEINASDERSGKLVSDRVRGVSDSHRLTASGKLDKPVCIVADEVEGAAESGFIQVLMQLIRGDELALRKHNGKTNRKEKHILLKRPIIAICNDVFASCLRNLRPYCEIVHYTRSTPQVLSAALQRIRKAENLQLNDNNLLAIANSADGDLRQCLNMMQLTVDSNLGQDTFEKDLDINWSKMVNKVFRTEADSGNGSFALKRHIEAIDFDKTIMGSFHLYPEIPYSDDLLTKPANIGEWNHFYEQINKAVYQKQMGQMGQYLSSVVLAYHERFQSRSCGSKDRRVPTDFEYAEASRQNRQMSQDFWNHISLPIKSMFSHNTVVGELVPYTLKIISPTLQSGALRRQAISEQTEKIQKTAHKMIELDLRFVSEVLDNNVLVYRVEPPLEQIAVIDEAERQRCSVGVYSVRDKIKECMRSMKGDDQSSSVLKRAREQDMEIIDSGRPLKRATKHQTSLAQKNFFGVVQQVPEVPVSQQTAASQSDKTSTAVNERIWVKFIEGFSNAVKKDLTWNDIWQG